MHSNNANDMTSARGNGQLPLAPRQMGLAFQEHNFTWEQVLRVLRKHTRFALTTAGIVSALTIAYALSQKNYYRPVARLEIAPPGTGINTLHEIDSTIPSENQDYLETQVQILKSDALAMSVIRELHLDRNPEFVSKAMIAESAKLAPDRRKPPGQLALLQEQIDLATLSKAEYAALEQFQRRLAASSVRNTRLAEVSFTANDAASAQMIVNTLIAKFIDQNYRHRYNSTMQASDWLSTQLDDLRKKVEDSGREVATYQKKYGLVDVDDHDVPMSQFLNEVNHQLSEAQANRIEDEAYVRMIEEGHGESIPAFRDDKLYQDLMGHYADLRTQLVQVRAVYGDANVNVKKLQDQLQEVSSQIDAERSRVIARARSLYSGARARETLMLNERQQVMGKMAAKSSQLTVFHMLKEEANANAALYNMLQGRLQEAGIYAGLRSSNIRVVDMAANLQKPTGPHRPLTIALGMMAACTFAVVLSFVHESFRNTVLTPEDVKSWTGLPSLALLPAMRAAEIADGETWSLLSRKSSSAGNVEIMKALTAESEAMRDLRAALVNARTTNTPRVILISSSIEGEGKTTVAVNFAVALAQIGRTCLLDADLRQPSVAKVFKMEARASMADVLERKVTLASALVEAADVPNLSILVCGAGPGSPADVLSSEEMGSLLDVLRSEFTFVVIDSPPVIRFSDARFLSALADEVVLVGRYGVTTRRAMQRTAELLGEMRASVAGVVLNGIDLSSPDYEFYTYGYASGRNKGGDSTYARNSNGPGPGTNGKPGAMRAHA